MFKSWKSLFVRGTVGSKGSARAAQPKKKTRRASLSVEALEDRFVPSTLTVSSTLDDLSAGTLRSAIKQANSDGAQGTGDSISFATGIDATHILLQGGHLELAAGAKVSIFGTGSFGAKMVLNGDGGNIFQVDSGAWLDLHELTLAGGDATAFTSPNGGAIENDGTLTLSLCSFVSNTATGLGGAIYNTGNFTVHFASTFTGNTAQLGGGAVYNAAGGTASLIGTFSTNFAKGGAGGALFNNGAMNVYDSTLSGNTAQANGGAIDTNGVMTVADSCLSANYSQQGGGAIVNQSSATLTVSTSTLANNSSAATGGAINNSGALTLSAATVSGNHAVSGAGIATQNPLTLEDTIVAGNKQWSTTNGVVPDITGSATTFSGYNLIGDGDGLSGIGNGINHNQIGSGTAPINPLLFPLGNFGGTTQTMPPQPSSPAVGAGSSVTTLTAAIGTQDTVLPVGYAAAIASTASFDGLIHIDGEVMSVTNVDPTNNTVTVERLGNPNPAKAPKSHAAGAGVYFANDQSFTPVLPSAVAVGAAQTTTGPATKFGVTGPTPFGEISGVGFTVTITAQDVNGNTATQYNGPVTLTEPGDTFTVALTNGVGTVTVGVDKAATGTVLNATDGSISGASAPFTVYGNVPTKLTITAPPTPTAGLGFNATVTGTDWFGNPANGLVTVVSSDHEPADAVVLSNGQALDPITLDKAGTDTLTATHGAATASTNLAVNPGDAIALAVSATPSTVTAGDTVTVTASRLDAFGNLANAGLIETTLSCSDSQVASFVPVTFGNHGTATLQFKLVKAEAVTFTASWSAPIPIGPPITSTSNVVTVNPGGALKFIVGAGATQLAGTPFNVSITPEDFYNNVTTFTGPLTISSSDFQPVGGGTGINARGQGATNVFVTLSDPGVVTLTVNANGQTLFGNSNSITVDAVTTQPANWSGYVLDPGSQANAVGGSWVQPAASGTGTTAFWVGIDGWYGSNTVEQIGTQVQMVGGSPRYSVWYEMVPQNPVEVPITTTNSGSPFVLQAGDQISAAVQYGSSVGPTSTFVLQISDAPANGGPVEFFSTTQTIANAPRFSAEWIVETPLFSTGYSTLANFGQVTFTGAWATVGASPGSINTSPNAIALNMNTGLAHDYTSNPPVSSNTLGYKEPTMVFGGVTSSSFTVTYGTAPVSGGVAGGPSGGVGLRATTGPLGGAILAGSAEGEALAFSAPTYSFDEKAGTITLTINRTSGIDGTDGTTAVQYDVSAATGLKTKYQAVPNTDFTGNLHGTVTFNPGETQKTVTFAMTADNLVEENKSFVVTLSNPTGGASLGSQVSTTVTIVDDNLPVVPNATPKLPVLQKAGIGFGTSDEHYQQFVRNAYDHYLRRTPSDAELKYWVDLMKVYETDHTKGLKQEQIEAGFIDSKEYIGRFGTVGKAWIDGIYQDLLARSPDASGESYWVGQLNARMDPARVALGFTTSLERLQNRVSATYQSLLERAPDADGLKYWLNIFNSGGTTEDINSGFVGSAEYYNKADGAAGNPDRWVREAYLDILFRSAQVSEMTYWSNFLNG